MPTVTVTRANVPRAEAIEVVRKEMGQEYVVEPGGHEDVFSVKKGMMSGAKVHIRQHDGATQFHIHGTGFIIGRIINELGIANRVAGALKSAPLDQAPEATSPTT